MDNSLVSIIVPVYNVEKYLEQCISSILEQTYTNFELILVDDGSTDKSGDICDEWFKKDSRIKVFHQRNQGLSAARNRGIELAKGEYFCFVDSDDFVTKEYVKDFMEAIEREDADFALCDIVSAKLTNTDIKADEEKILTGEDCKEWLKNPISREYVLMVVAWNKMYKRQLFDDYRFVHGKLHEDEFMINHMVFNIEKVVYIPKPNYIYRNNDSGITGANNVGNIEHLHVIDAYEERIKMALENNDMEFARTTLKWALLKLAQYYRDGSANMQKHSKSLFIRLYDNYSELLSDKQKAKYKVFKTAPKIFCKMFL